VYGTREVDRRVPTAAFNVGGHRPAAVAQELADRGIFVWDGNYYALELMQRLGLEDSGGAVRVGAVHYNTAAEIDLFLEAVAAL
jgi:selenocysteine lyase/cysteine desulfurase